MKNRATSRAVTALAIIVGALSVAPRAFALCDIDGNCAGSPRVCTCDGTGDCEVTTEEKNFLPGDIIDCPGRKIWLKYPSGKINIEDGIITIKAREIRVEGNHKINATRSSGSLADFGFRIVLEDKLDVEGALEAISLTGGGSIEVETGGDMLFPNNVGAAVHARATGTNAPGGEIVLESGGNVVIEDSIVADAHSTTTASSAAGGTITITAAGSITVADKISAKGRGDGAGSIELNSRGTVDAAGDELTAPDTVPCTSSDQTSRIDIVSPNGLVQAEGSQSDGNGGQIQLMARAISIAAPMSAQGGEGVSGGDSTGGAIDVNGGDCGVSISDDLDVTGGGDVGGSLQLESDGDLVIGSGVELLARSDANGGGGGSASLRSGGTLTVSDGALIDARGHTGSGGQGRGGAIDLLGCTASIGAATIDAGGYTGGGVELTAPNSITVAANAAVHATGSGGAIRLVTRPGWCADSPATPCSSGSCVIPPSGPGRCSNDLVRSCYMNADCTIGCQTGQCLRGTCANDPAQRCHSDALCENLGCATGACNLRWSVGTGSQFDPAVQKQMNAALQQCD